MFEELVSGKRIALVGPGAQTEIMKLGSVIDSYDLVARTGHNNILVIDEIGSRTDIICENFWFWDTRNYNIDKQGLYNEWVKQGVKYFNHIWPQNEGLDEFKSVNAGRVPIRLQPDNVIRDIRQCVGSPTKGMCAVWDLLTFPIKELFIVGFTCCKGFGYRKDYFTNPFNMPKGEPEYVDPSYSVHNLDKWTVCVKGYDHPVESELNWFKGIKDKRVHYDEWMERILCV